MKFYKFVKLWCLSLACCLSYLLSSEHVTKHLYSDDGQLIRTKGNGVWVLFIMTVEILKVISLVVVVVVVDVVVLLLWWCWCCGGSVGVGSRSSSNTSIGSCCSCCSRHSG